MWSLATVLRSIALLVEEGLASRRDILAGLFVEDEPAILREFCLFAGRGGSGTSFALACAGSVGLAFLGGLAANDLGEGLLEAVTVREEPSHLHGFVERDAVSHELL